MSVQAKFNDRPLETTLEILEGASTDDVITMFEESAAWLVTNGVNKYELMAKLKRELI